MASPGRPHPPSQARALVQEAKSGRGRPLRELLGEAAQIADPSFAAEALMALSQDQRLSAQQAGAILDDVVARVELVSRGWRKAEVIAELAKRAAKWRPGPAATPARNAFVDRLVAAAVAMPPGQGQSLAVQGVAPAARPRHVEQLLATALANTGFAVEDAKAVLRAAAENGEAGAAAAHLQQCPDVALRARLLGALHHHVAKQDPAHARAVLDHALATVARVADAAVQVEILRGLVASSTAVPALHRVVDGVRGHGGPEVMARILSAAGGRADRLGDSGQAKAWLAEGLQVAAQVPDAAARRSVEANLQEGLQRLAGGQARAGTAHPAPEGGMALATAAPHGATSGARQAQQEAVPLSASGSPSGSTTTAQRHVLALYDTYEGGVKDVHVRAIARAAPLCHAFGLDLALLGFPTTDLAALARATTAETNIGEGGGYLEELVREGRVLLVACTTKEPPSDWTRLGHPVATTPAPAEGKSVTLDGALQQAREAGAPRICLVMGLGKRGLPASLLRAAPAHLELTGRNVSLETATAMGVMAERLRNLPRLGQA